MRELMNILYCHGLGSSINNRISASLMEYFRKTPHYFERLLYRNPGSRHVLWNISEWREDIEKRVDGQEWVVIASSAGCHAALNAARNRPHDIKGLFLFCPGVSLSFDYVDNIIPGGSAALRNGQTLIHPASRGGHEALVDREHLQHYLDVGDVINYSLQLLHSNVLVPLYYTVLFSRNGGFEAQLRSRVLLYLNTLVVVLRNNEPNFYRFL
uniref:Hydrolase_4 domain-containing protein n=1 Tax=Angiostrongylus cantonensis TaxID=6313 RepID=A0A0K0DFQ9_ANGCA